MNQYLLDNSSDADHTANEHVNPFVKVHSLLRGRYAWAIMLSLIGAVVGVALGYWLYVPEYRSNGAVLIRPYIPRVLFKSEETSVMPMYDGFISTQIGLIMNPRVVSLALEDEKWKSLERDTAHAIGDFRKNMSVSRLKRSQMIRVSFTDKDPKAAQIAVRSIIAAYQRLFAEGEIRKEERTIRTLEDRRTSLSARSIAYQDQILEIAREYGGPESLDSMYAFKIREFQKLQTAFEEAQFALAQAGEQAHDTKNGNRKVTPTELTSYEIAAVDSRMRAYLNKLEMIEVRLGTLRATNIGGKHRSVISVKGELEVISKLIEDYTKRYNEQFLASGNYDVSETGVSGTVNVKLLRKRSVILEQLATKAKEEARTLEQKKMEIADLERKVETTKAKSEYTTSRIEQLNVESGVSGRIEIISNGDFPLVPDNSERQAKLALLGAVGGLVIGFGIVLIVGIFDRRIRTSQDAGTRLGDVRLLGILPNLPDDLDDPEHAAIAGFCVHHIRTLLQISSTGNDYKVTTITSPASGTGKTSLTLALGMSFAGSGVRTLLIDCDMIGRSLTTRLGAMIRRRIGQIFIKQGLITAEQLEIALNTAKETGRQLGETLVELDMLDETDVSSALALQEKTPVGLMDVLAGEDLANCVAETGIDGLSILPVGDATAADSTRVSPAAVKHVFEEARQQYDTILIDTGPISGSLETSVVACESDGVVMIVSRGEQKNQAEQTLAFLQSIGAHISGLVFNRAEGADIARSVHSASLLAQSVSVDDVDEAERQTQDEMTRMSKYGPLAGALTSAVHRIKQVADHGESSANKDK